MSKTIVWVVGKFMGIVVTNTKDECNYWEMEGIFSSEQLAIKACKLNRHFIGPMELDEPCPEETALWPGAYYPRLNKKLEKESG